MKIVFDPTKSNTNAYVNLITSALEKNGISTYSMNEVFKDWSLFSSIAIVHLNWFENVNSIAEFGKKVSKLLLFILFGKKIVWTFHNKQPHKQSFGKLSSLLMKWLAKYTSNIVIHSCISEDILVRYYGNQVRTKIVYVPHPNYIDVYGPSKLSECEASTSDHLSLLFVGAVKPYKNIELLIEAIKDSNPKEVHLTIVGKPSTSEYQAKIESMVAGMSNVVLRLAFVNDEDLGSLIARHDLLALPYNKESSLNSGSVILAFSYGRTVMCPNIGTLLDFEDASNIMGYDYDDADSHLQAIKNSLQKAIEIKKADKEAFHKMGAKLFEIVGKENDIAIVSDRLSNLYKKIRKVS